uniref:Nuclear pore complex protein Nup155-like n=1 Tax=Callorhinchus milii TaxID=7868 RepID=A0A4W3GRG1_CALMI
MAGQRLKGPNSLLCSYMLCYVRCVCTVCVRCMYGVCTVCVRCVYGVCTVCMYVVYVRCVCMLCMYGVYVRCVCTVCMYGVCTVYVRCVCTVYVDEGNGVFVVQFEQTLALAQRSTDELFNIALFNWLLQTDLPDKLLEVNSPYLEPYLLRMAKQEQNTVRYMDLLWRYYEKNRNFSNAARILARLADLHRYRAAHTPHTPHRHRAHAAHTPRTRHTHAARD